MGGILWLGASQNGSYWLLSIWSAGSAGYQGNVPDNPSTVHREGGRAMAKAAALSSVASAIRPSP